MYLSFSILLTNYDLFDIGMSTTRYNICNWYTSRISRNSYDDNEVRKFVIVNTSNITKYNIVLLPMIITLYLVVEIYFPGK